MADDFSMDTRQDVVIKAVEKKLGFMIEKSFSSPIGLVVEEQFQDIDDLIRLSAFTLFLERRHVDSGMPECSVEGKNIRRLAILLLRNRNVKHIIIMQNKENIPLKHTLENIRNLAENTIADEKFEYLWTRGRFDRHGFQKGELRSAFSSVSNVEEEPYSENDLPEVGKKVIEKMERYIIEVEKAVLPPPNLRSFYAPPSSLDDYIIPQAAPTQNITPERVLHAVDISTLFRLCEQVLFSFGHEVTDYKGIGRWQLGQEVVLELNMSRNGSESEWKKTLAGFLVEMENFLGGIGIKDSRRIYKTSAFYDRLFREENRERIRHEEFVERVSDDIRDQRLGDSNASVILIGTDDLRTRKKSKIGWSGIRCYMKPQNGYTSLALSHDLRSIDLYDGFPVNLFFCLEYSLKFIRDLIEKQSYESRPRVRLENLRFVIHHLHAYLDDVPITLIKRCQYPKKE